MGKIQVEDLTKPPSTKEKIVATAHATLMYVSRLGAIQGMCPRDMLCVIMTCAEMMKKCTYVLDIITDEEVVEIKNEVTNFSKTAEFERFLELVKQTADNIKRSRV
jgi:hypothetical protein